MYSIPLTCPLEWSLSLHLTCLPLEPSNQVSGIEVSKMDLRMEEAVGAPTIASNNLYLHKVPAYL